MIRSGLVSQHKARFESGFPHQRNNHPRNETIRPWVSGFDLPVMEKSTYATPYDPDGASKTGIAVKTSASIKYKDIFGKTASPDTKYYLAQLVKRLSRGGGGLGGGGYDTGGGPGGMGGPQRPVGATIPPPGQNPTPGLPVEAPGQAPGVPQPTPSPPSLMGETDTSPDIDMEYEMVTMNDEMNAEVQFENIFYNPIDSQNAEIAWMHGDGQDKRFQDDFETPIPVSTREEIPSDVVLHTRQVTSSGPTKTSDHKHREYSFHKDVRYKPYEPGTIRKSKLGTSQLVGMTESQVMKAEAVNGISLKRVREDDHAERKSRKTTDKDIYPYTKRKFSGSGSGVSKKQKTTISQIRSGLKINTDVPKVAGPKVRKTKITQPMGIPTRRSNRQI